MDPQKLLPAIHGILARSDKDSISAKGVRRKLQELFPELDVKKYKAAIDALTVQAFETDVSTDDIKPALPSSSKRPRSPSPTSSPAYLLSQMPKIKKEPRQESDEAYAKRLQGELNGSRTTRGEASGANERKKKKVWGSRSKTTIDSDDDASSGKKQRKVSTTGFNKPHRLSQVLADVVGADVMSRPQVTKHLWIYIKANDLQNPSDKREIILDEKLSRVLPGRIISSFQMAKHIGPHLFPYEAPAE